MSLRPSFDSLHTDLHGLLLLMLRASSAATDMLARARECMICPISYDILTDPVICSDGFSFQRGDIERWLRESRVSPMTGAALANTTLISNHSLKSIIESLT